MKTYLPPLTDILSALNDAGFDAVARLPGFEHVDRSTVTELLGEFGRFVTGEIGPLNRSGDTEGSSLRDGRVRTPSGWRAAYRRYVESGWASVPFPTEYGGGGFPWLVCIAMQEILAAANVAFSLCPMLTQSAIELLTRWGTADQQRRFVPQLVSGAWAGTMNLTEADAGSDVGHLRTAARPNEDGTWSITGTKIFITWGDHDLTDNIIHFVLARARGAPSGTRGISLFAVPARWVDADGHLGELNRVCCVSLEKKLGIHASPTCVMAFDAARGELVGEVNTGMRAMFSMMNTARLSVGVQGLGLSEHAYQLAFEHAHQRRQGRGINSDRGATVSIIEHPDVQRMLLTMRSKIDAMRILLYTAAQQLDVARHHPNDRDRQGAQQLVDFLVPIAKSWPTDVVNEITSLAIQVHGGLGYIEETGVAQLYRDARIASIYEGTNGIQAIDLATRKLGMDPDDPLPLILMDIERTVTSLECELPLLVDGCDRLRGAAQAVDRCARLMVARQSEDRRGLHAAASTFLEQTAILLGGWVLARSVLNDQSSARLDSNPREGRAATSFYLTQVLPVVDGLRAIIESPFGELSALDTADLASR